MSKKRIGVSIFGGTGYGAGELMRLLAGHPEAEVVSVISSSSAGKEVSAHHTHLKGFCDFPFSAELKTESLKGCAQKVVFFSLPHGASASTIGSLLPVLEGEKMKVIDLSGDFRLKDEELRKKHYGDDKGREELIGRFIFGLSELNREKIVKAQYLSNPGCLASACILAAAPLVAGRAAGDIVFDAKTGTSGAGRTPQANFHHPEVHTGAFAYKILEHRHEPEIAQALSETGGRKVDISFVPHVIPLSRGIYATAYLTLVEKSSREELLDCYRRFYENCPFIRIRTTAPHLADVTGSNFCDITVVVRGKRVVAVAALDNLVKGMAGQAIQNMNLMCGLPEETGLLIPSLRP